MLGNTMTLIIEDNPGDALLLKEQLNHAGWPATNSFHKVKLIDAIKRLEDIRPVVVFLDLNLPDSNGIETFLSVNSVAPDVVCQIWRSSIYSIGNSVGNIHNCSGTTYQHSETFKGYGSGYQP